MKKATFIILILTFVFSCTSKQNEVDRIVEDGIEVVINHLEPYKIQGEPSFFSLNEEFGIDTERDEIAELGLVDIGAFDVDAEGNIYILCSRNKENSIFKFDNNGSFVFSFGEKGQGPGEFQSPTFLGIDSNSKIHITDAGKRRLITFDKEGNFEKEFPFENRIIFVNPLANGNHLAFFQKFDLPGSEYSSQSPLILWNSEFEEIKEIGRLKLLNYSSQRKRKGTIPIFCWSVSGRHIYFGDENEGYEIKAFDFDGNILRKIRKKYKKVPVPYEYKKEILENMRPQDRKITFFPDSFPAYQAFFSDDMGRLFVMTYEKSEIQGEYMYNVFNPKGVYIGRKSLHGFARRGGHIWAIVKGDYLYGTIQKKSGYKALIVYKIDWE